MVVDDSVVIRGLISRWIEAEPDMVVAASLRTGLDAVNQVFLGRLHHCHAGRRLDDLLRTVRLDEGDLGHAPPGETLLIAALAGE